MSGLVSLYSVLIPVKHLSPLFSPDSSLIKLDLARCTPTLHVILWCHAAAPERLPWGTHAYIIRAETAERMANLGEWMISRARKNTKDKTPWALDGDDIKIDHFIGNFYKKLVNEVERERCDHDVSTLHLSPRATQHACAAGLLMRVLRLA